MITNKDYFAQLPKERKQGFSELNVAIISEKPILPSLRAILASLFLN